MNRGGNLRGAPLFLRPWVVRGLVEGVEAIRKGLVELPILPIQLVDQPRRSEDPRLAKANDDSMPARWVAPAVASEPEDWPDAPLPDHSDPDLDRPAPQDLPIPVEAIGNGIALKRAPKIDWQQVVRARRAKAAPAPKKNIGRCSPPQAARNARVAGSPAGRAAITSCRARTGQWRPRRNPTSAS